MNANDANSTAAADAIGELTSKPGVREPILKLLILAVCQIVDPDEISYQR